MSLDCILGKLTSPYMLNEALTFSLYTGCIITGAQYMEAFKGCCVCVCLVQFSSGDEN